MKRYIFLVLTLIMSWNVLFASVKIGNLYYNLDSRTKTASVTNIAGSMSEWKLGYGSSPSMYEGDIVIPSSVLYDGVTYTVTSIGDAAFYKGYSITSITIPNSVTSIGNWAFYHCSRLTSITIPNRVPSIGSSAFSYCSRLISITIPNSVTSIGEHAFYSCTGLISITIPNSVTSIGEYAFYNCPGLTSITIPSSVTSIGNSAFSHCEGLTSITIPDGVTCIGDATFNRCDKLTSITIPNSVTSIGMSAFSHCTGLISITIPNRVLSIGSSAFSYCSRLISITIPNSVTSIGMSAFSHCTGLISITIPNSVTSIGNSAFGDCSGLTSIVVDDRNSVYDSREDCNAIIETSTNTLLCGCQNTIIPNSVTSIGDYAFYGCRGLTSVTIPDSITSIGHYAFSGCSGLTSIIIPNNVTSMGDYAFAGCSGLTSLSILAIVPPKISSITFYNVPTTIPVYIPCGTKEAYRSAEYWSDFTNYIEEWFYTLTVATNNENMGSAQITKEATPCSDNEGIIEAIANEHYHFVQWNDGNTDNPRSVYVNGDAIYTAEFAIDQHTISLNADKGMVSGAGTYDYGTHVIITATPDEHYHFVQWSDGNTDNPRTISVEGDITLTALFAIDRFTITATCDEIRGETMGSGIYDYGEHITLTAIPNSGYEFKQWSNGLSYNPYRFTVVSDLTLEAEFVPATGVDNISASDGNQPLKVIYQGQLLILSGDCVYTPTGVKVNLDPQVISSRAAQP